MWITPDPIETVPFSKRVSEGTPAGTTVEVRDIKGDFTWRNKIGGGA
jgi:hypothetical protein